MPAPSKPAPPPAGVEFPVDADGKRGSLGINQETFAVAVEAVDADRAGKVRAEKKWRGKYQQYVCENVRASLTSPDAALKVANAGLKHLHETMRFVRDGQETSLAEAMKKYKDPKFHQCVIQGERPLKSKFGVPYKLFGKKGDLVELTDNELRVQIDKWVKQGVIEVSTAHALNKVAENPGWCDLSDQYFVLFGASSAMGPYPILMAHGANVIALDLWLPDGKFSAVWKRLFETAKNSSGRLIFPVREAGVKVDGKPEEDAKLQAVAGCNLITEAPEIRTFLMDLLPEKRLICFALAYLDGALFVKVSMAMDAIIQELVKGRKTKPALAYLCTPTDCHVCTTASVTAATANSRKMSMLQSIIASLLGMAGPKMALRKNVEKPVLDKQGETLPLQIVDCIIPQQGPNYILAKRLQHWRAMVARDAGCLVSSNVAPSTATASVLSNVSFALSYKGFEYFKPLEVTYPDTSNAVMFGCLISDLRDPTSNANPETPLPNPLCLFSDKSFHGGAWRAGFKFAGIGAAALVQYGVNAFITAPYLLGYSAYQAVGWGKAFAAVLANVQGASAPLWSTAGPFVTYYQNLALLEVAHAALGLTSSNAAMTFLQIFSRVALVAVLNEFPGDYKENPWCIRAMLFAWCLTEVVRYSFYAVNQTKDLLTTVKSMLIATKKAKGDKLGEAKEPFKVPFPLLWLRYSLFLVLYPMGVSGEIGCMFQTLTKIITMGASKQASGVGNLVLDYCLRPGLGSFGWTGAAVTVLLVYILGLPPLFNMMLGARRKTLGGGKPRGASKNKGQ